MQSGARDDESEDPAVGFAFAGISCLVGQGFWRGSKGPGG